MNNPNKNVTWFLTVAIALFVIPIIAVSFGWLGGILAQFFFGNLITSGLNLLFVTDRFEASDIPTICATLSLIGGYIATKNMKGSEK